MKTLPKKDEITLNSEIEHQRRAKKVPLTVLTIILLIIVVGPLFMLIALDNDFIHGLINGAFNSWKFQFYLLIILLLITNYIYIRWRFLRK